MKPCRRTLLALVGMCMALSLANAQNQTTPKVNELLQLHALGAFALSPDGKTIAFEVQQPDYQVDNYRIKLVLEKTRSQKYPSYAHARRNPRSFRVVTRRSMIGRADLSEIRQRSDLGHTVKRWLSLASL